MCLCKTNRRYTCKKCCVHKYDWGEDEWIKEAQAALSKQSLSIKPTSRTTPPPHENTSIREEQQDEQVQVQTTTPLIEIEDDPEIECEPECDEDKQNLTPSTSKWEPQILTNKQQTPASQQVSLDTLTRAMEAQARLLTTWMTGQQQTTIQASNNTMGKYRKAH
ncbi:hypothetical protein Pmani_008647 [Petrolisthes manimaculis]|uniref:Uncharacterized protein n=1 Tax=Petrolisthes manimaculis TaxID=1843537 RepID=A0AAE1UHJ6_9EUCA|nr:hypothetical protein Pmani_008647 [Petrolisthes manimaculis]